MATRATYQINDTTFYIHWDGYLAGAAAFFYNMIERNITIKHTESCFGNVIEIAKGGFEFAFIRGNKGCEATDSHDAHGDTVYRYIVTTNDPLYDEPMIKVYVRKYYELVSLGGSEDYDWQVLHDEPLISFINKQSSDLCFQELSNKGKGVVSFGDYICTVEQALEANKEFYKKLKEINAKDEKHPHNDYIKDRISKIETAIQEISPQKVYA